MSDKRERYHFVLKPKEHPVNEDEATFKTYLEDFQITPEYLKGKRILDFGSGSGAEFANYCLKNGLTDFIVSIDRREYSREDRVKSLIIKYLLSDIDNFAEGKQHDSSVKKETIPAKKKETIPAKRTFVTAEGEALPFKPETFDLILARASIDNPNENRIKILINLINALRKNGEIRIAPFLSKYGGHILLKQKFERFLNTYNDGSWEYEWKEGLVKNERLGRRDLLIIRKRQ